MLNTLEINFYTEQHFGTGDYEIFILDNVCFGTEVDSTERSFNCESLLALELEPIKNSWVRKLVANGLFVCLTQNKKLLFMNGICSVLFGNKLGGFLPSQFSNKFGESALSRSSSFFVTSGKLVRLDSPISPTSIFSFAGCQTLFWRISKTFGRPPYAPA